MNTATNCFQSFPSCLISPLETMAIDLICLVAFFLFLAFPLARIPAPFSRVNCVGRLGGSRGFRAWRFSFFSIHLIGPAVWVPPTCLARPRIAQRLAE